MTSGAGGYWTEGRHLIIEDGAALPKEVCLLTGDAATTREHASFDYLSPALKILGKFVPFVHLVGTRTVRFSCGLSPAVLQRQSNARGSLFAGLCIGGTLIMVGELGGLSGLVPLGVVIIVLGVLVSARLNRGLEVVRVQEGRVTLAVAPAVLSALGLDDEDDDRGLEAREVEARQSSATRIHELEGARVRSVIGVAPQEEDGLIYAYIRAGGRWFRFYVDAGALFFSPESGPRSGDCVEQGDRWVDVFEPNEELDATITRLEYADSVLELELAGGTTLRFADNPDTELLEVMIV